MVHKHCGVVLSSLLISLILVYTAQSQHQGESPLNAEASLLVAANRAPFDWNSPDDFSKLDGIWTGQTAWDTNRNHRQKQKVKKRHNTDDSCFDWDDSGISDNNEWLHQRGPSINVSMVISWDCKKNCVEMVAHVGVLEERKSMVRNAIIKGRLLASGVETNITYKNQQIACEVMIPDVERPQSDKPIVARHANHIFVRLNKRWYPTADLISILGYHPALFYSIPKEYDTYVLNVMYRIISGQLVKTNKKSKKVVNGKQVTVTYMNDPKDDKYPKNTVFLHKNYIYCKIRSKIILIGRFERIANRASLKLIPDIRFKYANNQLQSTSYVNITMKPSKNVQLNLFRDPDNADFQGRIGIANRKELYYDVTGQNDWIIIGVLHRKHTPTTTTPAPPTIPPIDPQYIPMLQYISWLVSWNLMTPVGTPHTIELFDSTKVTVTSIVQSADPKYANPDTVALGSDGQLYVFLDFWRPLGLFPVNEEAEFAIRYVKMMQSLDLLENVGKKTDIILGDRRPQRVIYERIPLDHTFSEPGQIAHKNELWYMKHSADLWVLVGVKQPLSTSRIYTVEYIKLLLSLGMLEPNGASANMQTPNQAQVMIKILGDRTSGTFPNTIGTDGGRIVVKLEDIWVPVSTDEHSVILTPDDIAYYNWMVSLDLLKPSGQVEQITLPNGNSVQLTIVVDELTGPSPYPIAQGNDNQMYIKVNEIWVSIGEMYEKLKVPTGSLEYYVILDQFQGLVSEGPSFDITLPNKQVITLDPVKPQYTGPSLKPLALGNDRILFTQLNETWIPVSKVEKISPLPADVIKYYHIMFKLDLLSPSGGPVLKITLPNAEKVHLRIIEDKLGGENAVKMGTYKDVLYFYINNMWVPVGNKEPPINIVLSYLTNKYENGLYGPNGKTVQTQLPDTRTIVLELLNSTDSEPNSPNMATYEGILFIEIDKIWIPVTKAKEDNTMVVYIRLLESLNLYAEQEGETVIEVPGMSEPLTGVELVYFGFSPRVVRVNKILYAFLNGQWIEVGNADNIIDRAYIVNFIKVLHTNSFFKPGENLNISVLGTNETISAVSQLYDFYPGMEVVKNDDGFFVRIDDLWVMIFKLSDVSEPNGNAPKIIPIISVQPYNETNQKVHIKKPTPTVITILQPAGTSSLTVGADSKIIYVYLNSTWIPAVLKPEKPAISRITIDTITYLIDISVLVRSNKTEIINYPGMPANTSITIMEGPHGDIDVEIGVSDGIIYVLINGFWIPIGKEPVPSLKPNEVRGLITAIINDILPSCDNNSVKIEGPDGDTLCSIQERPGYEFPFQIAASPKGIWINGNGQWILIYPFDPKPEAIYRPDINFVCTQMTYQNIKPQPGTHEIITYDGKRMSVHDVEFTYLPAQMQVVMDDHFIYGYMDSLWLPLCERNNQSDRYSTQDITVQWIISGVNVRPVNVTIYPNQKVNASQIIIPNLDSPAIYYNDTIWILDPTTNEYLPVAPGKDPQLLGILDLISDLIMADQLQPTGQKRVIIVDGKKIKVHYPTVDAIPEFSKPGSIAISGQIVYILYNNVWYHVGSMNKYKQKYFDELVRYISVVISRDRYIEKPDDQPGALGNGFVVPNTTILTDPQDPIVTEDNYKLVRDSNGYIYVEYNNRLVLIGHKDDLYKTEIFDTIKDIVIMINNGKVVVGNNRKEITQLNKTIPVDETVFPPMDSVPPGNLVLDAKNWVIVRIADVWYPVDENKERDPFPTFGNLTDTGNETNIIIDNRNVTVSIIDTDPPLPEGQALVKYGGFMYIVNFTETYLVGRAPDYIPTIKDNMGDYISIAPLRNTTIHVLISDGESNIPAWYIDTPDYTSPYKLVITGNGRVYGEVNGEFVYITTKVLNSRDKDQNSLNIVRRFGEGSIVIDKKHIKIDVGNGPEVGQRLVSPDPNNPLDLDVVLVGQSLYYYQPKYAAYVFVNNVVIEDDPIRDEIRKMMRLGLVDVSPDDDIVDIEGEYQLAQKMVITDPAFKYPEVIIYVTQKKKMVYYKKPDSQTFILVGPYIEPTDPLLQNIRDALNDGSIYITGKPETIQYNNNTYEGKELKIDSPHTKDVKIVLTDTGKIIYMTPDGQVRQMDSPTLNINTEMGYHVRNIVLSNNWTLANDTELVKVNTGKPVPAWEMFIPNQPNNPEKVVIVGSVVYYYHNNTWNSVIGVDIEYNEILIKLLQNNQVHIIDKPEKVQINGKPTEVSPIIVPNVPLLSIPGKLVIDKNRYVYTQDGSKYTPLNLTLENVINVYELTIQIYDILQNNSYTITPKETVNLDGKNTSVHSIIAKDNPKYSEPGKLIYSGNTIYYRTEDGNYIQLYLTVRQVLTAHLVQLLEEYNITAWDESTVVIHGENHTVTPITLNENPEFDQPGVLAVLPNGTLIAKIEGDWQILPNVTVVLPTISPEESDIRTAIRNNGTIATQEPIEINLDGKLVEVVPITIDGSQFYDKPTNKLVVHEKEVYYLKDDLWIKVPGLEVIINDTPNNNDPSKDDLEEKLKDETPTISVNQPIIITVANKTEIFNPLVFNGTDALSTPYYVYNNTIYIRYPNNSFIDTEMPFEITPDKPDPILTDIINIINEGSVPTPGDTITVIIDGKEVPGVVETLPGVDVPLILVNDTLRYYVNETDTWIVVPGIDLGVLPYTDPAIERLLVILKEKKLVPVGDPEVVRTNGHITLMYELVIPGTEWSEPGKWVAIDGKLWERNGDTLTLVPNVVVTMPDDELIIEILNLLEDHKPEVAGDPVLVEIDGQEVLKYNVTIPDTIYSEPGKLISANRELYIVNPDGSLTKVPGVEIQVTDDERLKEVLKALQQGEPELVSDPTIVLYEHHNTLQYEVFIPNSKFSEPGDLVTIDGKLFIREGPNIVLVPGVTLPKVTDPDILEVLRALESGSIELIDTVEYRRDDYDKLVPVQNCTITNSEFAKHHRFLTMDKGFYIRVTDNDLKLIPGVKMPALKTDPEVWEVIEALNTDNEPVIHETQYMTDENGITVPFAYVTIPNTNFNETGHLLVKGDQLFIVTPENTLKLVPVEGVPNLKVDPEVDDVKEIIKNGTEFEPSGKPRVIYDENGKVHVIQDVILPGTKFDQPGIIIVEDKKVFFVRDNELIEIPGITADETLQPNTDIKDVIIAVNESHIIISPEIKYIDFDGKNTSYQEVTIPNTKFNEPGHLIVIQNKVYIVDNDTLVPVPTLNTKVLEVNDVLNTNHTIEGVSAPRYEEINGTKVVIQEVRIPGTNFDEPGVLFTIGKHLYIKDGDTYIIVPNFTLNNEPQVDPQVEVVLELLQKNPLEIDPTPFQVTDENGIVMDAYNASIPNTEYAKPGDLLVINSTLCIFKDGKLTLIQHIDYEPTPQNPAVTDVLHILETTKTFEVVGPPRYETDANGKQVVVQDLQIPDTKYDSRGSLISIDDKIYVKDDTKYYLVPGYTITVPTVDPDVQSLIDELKNHTIFIDPNPRTVKDKEGKEVPANDATIPDTIFGKPGKLIVIENKLYLIKNEQLIFIQEVEVPPMPEQNPKLVELLKLLQENVTLEEAGPARYVVDANGKREPTQDLRIRGTIFDKPGSVVARGTTLYVRDGNSLIPVPNLSIPEPKVDPEVDRLFDALQNGQLSMNPIPHNVTDGNGNVMIAYDVTIPNSAFDQPGKLTIIDNKLYLVKEGGKLIFIQEVKTPDVPAQNPKVTEVLNLINDNHQLEEAGPARYIRDQNGNSVPTQNLRIPGTTFDKPGSLVVRGKQVYVVEGQTLIPVPGLQLKEEPKVDPEITLIFEAMDDNKLNVDPNPHQIKDAEGKPMDAYYVTIPGTNFDQPGKLLIINNKLYLNRESKLIFIQDVEMSEMPDQNPKVAELIKLLDQHSQMEQAGPARYITDQNGNKVVTQDMRIPGTSFAERGSIVVRGTQIYVRDGNQLIPVSRQIATEPTVDPEVQALFDALESGKISMDATPHDAKDGNGNAIVTYDATIPGTEFDKPGRLTIIDSKLYLNQNGRLTYIQDLQVGPVPQQDPKVDELKQLLQSHHTLEAAGPARYITDENGNRVATQNLRISGTSFNEPGSIVARGSQVYIRNGQTLILVPDVSLPNELVVDPEVQKLFDAMEGGKISMDATPHDAKDGNGNAIVTYDATIPGTEFDKPGRLTIIDSKLYLNQNGRLTYIQDLQVGPVPQQDPKVDELKQLLQSHHTLEAAGPARYVTDENGNRVATQNLRISGTSFNEPGSIVARGSQVYIRNGQTLILVPDVSLPNELVVDPEVQKLFDAMEGGKISMDATPHDAKDGNGNAIVTYDATIPGTEFDKPGRLTIIDSKLYLNQNGRLTYIQDLQVGPVPQQDPKVDELKQLLQSHHTLEAAGPARYITDENGNRVATQNLRISGTSFNEPGSIVARGSQVYIRNGQTLILVPDVSLPNELVVDPEVQKLFDAMEGGKISMDATPHDAKDGNGNAIVTYDATIPGTEFDKPGRLTIIDSKLYLNQNGRLTYIQDLQVGPVPQQDPKVDELKQLLQSHRTLEAAGPARYVTDENGNRVATQNLRISGTSFNEPGSIVARGSQVYIRNGQTLILVPDVSLPNELVVDPEVQKLFDAMEGGKISMDATPHDAKDGNGNAIVTYDATIPGTEFDKPGRLTIIDSKLYLNQNGRLTYIQDLQVGPVPQQDPKVDELKQLLQSHRTLEAAGPARYVTDENGNRVATQNLRISGTSFNEPGSIVARGSQVYIRNGQTLILVPDVSLPNELVVDPEVQSLFDALQTGQLSMSSSPKTVTGSDGKPMQSYDATIENSAFSQPGKLNIINSKLYLNRGGQLTYIQDVKMA